MYIFRCQARNIWELNVHLDWKSEHILYAFLSEMHCGVRILQIEKIITLNFYITHVRLFNPGPPSFLKVYFYLYYCVISSSSLVFSGYSQPCLSLETQHFPQDMSSNMDCWELCTSKNVRQTQPPIPGLCILRDNSKSTINHDGYYCHSRGSVDCFNFEYLVLLLLL